MKEDMTEPGRRFQDKYWHRQAHFKSASMLRKMFKWIFSGTVMAIGIILLFIPGPGWLVIILGASILAGESITLAKFMDNMEMRIREFIGRRKKDRV